MGFYRDEPDDDKIFSSGKDVRASKRQRDMEYKRRKDRNRYDDEDYADTHQYNVKKRDRRKVA